MFYIRVNGRNVDVTENPERRVFLTDKDPPDVNEIINFTFRDALKLKSLLVGSRTGFGRAGFGILSAAGFRFHYVACDSRKQFFPLDFVIILILTSISSVVSWGYDVFQLRSANT